MKSSTRLGQMSADSLRQDSGDVKSGDQQHQQDSSLRFHEIDLLQFFGILILVDLLPYTFAKASQKSAKDDWTPSF